MPATAKLFTNGRSQAVRLPAAFRFEGREVFIRRDEATGDVVLSRKPSDWGGFLRALEGVEVPADFPRPLDSPNEAEPRDPFAGWSE